MTEQPTPPTSIVSVEEAANEYGNKWNNFDDIAIIQERINSFKAGAAWQSNQKHIDEGELFLLLVDAKNQIQYLHEKFKETGTGNAIIAKIETYISNNLNHKI